jgi:lipopolysaccharide biosynthesis glycosyltransferase
MYVDQDLLNLAFSGNVYYLSLQWNVTMMFVESLVRNRAKDRNAVIEAFRNPDIVHYVGPNKPWIKPSGPFSTYYAELYFFYLKQMPFAAYDPDIRWKNSRFGEFVKYWARHPFLFARKSVRLRWKYRKIAKAVIKRITNTRSVWASK